MKNLAIIILVFFVASSFSACKNKPVDSTEEYQLPAEIELLPFGTSLGLRAPEIELKDSLGELKKLSDLRGKIVLLDFWAAWCNPCRIENPLLVQAYKKFHEESFTKGNGFEIFSVSLDRDEQAWKDAIEKDNLTWPYMLGDMKGARTQAAIDYGVQMIPTNFLLDQNGVILAGNLRGETLGEKLESLLKEKK